MKTSFTTIAVLAAVALAAPSFAQGNAFFDYQTHLAEPRGAPGARRRRRRASSRTR